MKTLKDKRASRDKDAGSAKWRKIRERAGELAMNHGKRARDADKEELQRAKRELLDMQITSPEG